MSKYFNEGNDSQCQLTIKEIKKQKEFENLSDNEAKELSNMLRVLSELTFEVFSYEQQSRSIQNLC